MEIIDLPKEEYLPIYAIVDNKSLIESLYSTKTVTEKHLKIDICIIREMLEKGEVKSVIWRESELQLADCLTKGGASTNKLLLALKGTTDIF